ncbi:alpha-L-arabinofuranosidase II [Xylariales sp. AK1849]|nr:alpha-L-arabinofuranosidase II [Xylariales sp. AK1849]
MQYDSSCHTLTSVGTPDPFMVRANGLFHLTFTGGDRIEIWSSRHLANFEQTAKKQVIWTPPPETEHSADLWAPELHAIGGRWYVYYAAAHPAHGNRSHRMYVLGGPPVIEDPTQGQWGFLGRIRDMPDQWAIDGTIFELNQELYFVYSGWPLDDRSKSDLIQQLFIVKLADPVTAGSRPVMISAPEQPWEFTRDGNGAHGINEGPQFLESPNARWKGIVFSCAGSWTHEYKLAVLHYTGGDPLHPRSWLKGQEPLLQAAGQGKGPWGPGHGTFLALGQQMVCVFHATDSPTDGWNNRKARCQQVLFTENGPYMGVHCGVGNREQPRKGGLMRAIRREIDKLREGPPEHQSPAPQQQITLKTLLESY